MDVTSVDSSAVLGRSALHRASPVSKLVATGLLLASVVAADDVFVIAGIALSVTAAAAAVGLPLRKMVPFALYPTLFAAVFAFASAPGPVTAALIVLKAVTAALAVVTLMFTTPYPQVFAPLQRVTPSLVGDALLMTYRSVFILADKFSDLARAVRLRAGLSGRHPVAAAKATTRALGGLMLYSFDLSQREYDILRLRGYERRLHVTRQAGTAPVADALAITLGIVALGATVLVRAVPSLVPYGWIVTATSLVFLAIGVSLGRRTR
ncbi:MAG: energy-coupling factor transporter transmembrane component T family protein [Coriobacteriia bacterium]